MNKFLVALSIVLFLGCSNNNKYAFNPKAINYDGTLDTLLPHFAKLHDSIPEKDRFLAKNKEFMTVHKTERQYQWHYYSQAENGYYYFLLSRLEPSLKRDKFAAICGRFKRDSKGAIDSASYEELFWTWKMKIVELKPKAEILFAEIIEKGNVDEYLTAKKGNDFWVEFPDEKTYYDKATQTWKAK